MKVVVMIPLLACILRANAATTIAATFNVNSTMDQVDATPLGDGVVDADLFTPGNQVTLRGAVQETNALAGADKIVLPAGTFTLTIFPMGPFEDFAAADDLDIRDALTIEGAGSGATIVANSVFMLPTRLFHIVGSTVTIKSLRMKNHDSTLFQSGGQNGDAIFNDGGNLTLGDGTAAGGVLIQPTSTSGIGGAIYNDGTLHAYFTDMLDGKGSSAGALYNDENAVAVLEDCQLKYNEQRAVDNRAGADLMVLRCVFEKNWSPGSYGGAIMNQATGIACIWESTFKANTGGIGGAVCNLGFYPDYSFVDIRRSVFHENYGEDGGAIINHYGQMVVKNTTLSCNSCAAAGGGGLFSNLDMFNAYCELDSCTVVYNRQLGPGFGRRGGGLAGTAPNGGAPMTVTNSIVALNISDAQPGQPDYDPADNISFIGPNWLIADPVIGQLQNNGGPTCTHALQPGSPCIDSGATALPTDQRNVARTGADDIGAFEGSLATPVGAGCTAPVTPIPGGPGSGSGGGGSGGGSTPP